MDGELLEGQLAYYRARADEYDNWFLRRGRYDRGPKWNRRWFSELDKIRQDSAASVRRDGCSSSRAARGYGR